jgi:hypothetical protein
MDVEQTSDAATEDEDCCTGRYPDSPLCPKHTGQGLNEGSFFKRNLIRQMIHAAVYIESRQLQVFRKTAGFKIGFAEGIAGGVMTPETIVTGVAGDVMGSRNTISLFISLNALSHSHNFARNLMTEDEGCLMNTIPFHYVTTANTTCFHPDQEFPRPDFRRRHLLNAYILISIIHGNAHALPCTSP